MSPALAKADPLGPVEPPSIQPYSGASENVPSFEQPDPSKPLVYGGTSPSNEFFLRGPEAHTPAIAVGDGYAYALDASRGVWRFNMRTDEGYVYGRVESTYELRHFAGLAVYDHQLWVGVPRASTVNVLADWISWGSQTETGRRIKVPNSLVLAGHDLSSQLGADFRITGLDVAWDEIWVALRAPNGSRAIEVLDRFSGAVKAVILDLREFDCEPDAAGVRQIEGLHPLVCGAQTDANRLAVACRPATGAVDVLKLSLDADRCKGEILNGSTPDAYDFSYEHEGPDIAAVPEEDAIVTGCLFIRRPLLLAATAIAQVDLTSLIVRDPACGGTHIDHYGVSATWGMHWKFEGQYDGYRNTFEFVERAIQPGGGVGPVVRRTTPRNLQYGNYVHNMDAAYVPRKERLDWWGELKETDWQRGTSCLSYVVSEADVLMAAYRYEHWYEQARSFQKLEIRVDGVLIDTLSEAAGSWCTDLSLFPSGVHDLELTAHINGGQRQIIERNDSLRIDHDVPTGQVDPLPRFVRDEVTLSGTLADAHSGPRDRALERAEGFSTSWTPMCGTQTPEAHGPAYQCAWQTNAIPDGPYRFRAQLRDLVADSHGGPNLGTTPEIRTVVDNNPPTVALSGALKDLAAAGTVPDGRHLLTVSAADGQGSGVKSIEILVDGVRQDLIEQPCADYGCTLDRQFTFVNDDFAEGRHTIRVRVVDHVGFSAESSLEVDIRNRPAVALSGALKDLADAGPVQDGRHVLQMDATDDGSGVKSIEVLVDGNRRDFVEQPCDDYACRMTRHFTFINDDYSEGQHTILVRVKDQVERVAEREFTVSVRNAPVISVSDQLWEFRNMAPVLASDRPALRADAADAGSGLQRIAVLVDGVEQSSTTAGGIDFTYSPGSYSNGTRDVRVTAIDNAGHQSSVSWTIRQDTRHRDWTARDAQAAAEDPPPNASVAPAATARSSSPLSNVAVPVDEQTDDDLVNAAWAGRDQLACTAADSLLNFDRYWLGTTFEGLPLTNIIRRCDAPYFRESNRANYVSYIYGDCDVEAEADTPDPSCTFPLEIKSWPICERDPSRYEIEPGVPYPRQNVTIEGAPAAIYDEGFRVEIYTRTATIVIFGHYYEQILRAAHAVQVLNPSVPMTVLPALAASNPTPSPATAAALSGELPCL